MSFDDFGSYAMTNSPNLHNGVLKPLPYIIRRRGDIVLWAKVLCANELIRATVLVIISMVSRLGYLVKSNSL